MNIYSVNFIVISACLCHHSLTVLSFQTLPLPLLPCSNPSPSYLSSHLIPPRPCALPFPIPSLAPLYTGPLPLALCKIVYSAIPVVAFHLFCTCLFLPAFFFLIPCMLLDYAFCLLPFCLLFLPACYQPLPADFPPLPKPLPALACITFK